MTDKPEIHVRRFASRAELDTALAQRLVQAITDTRNGGTALMLSGGTTPLPAYRELARQGPWPAPGLHALYSDERYVPASSEASNYHQSLPLIDALGLPESSVLRVRTELPLEEAARDYEERLAELLRSGVQIRLGLLGLGADGHTASLFSHDDLERAHGRLAIAVQRPDGMAAISVTPELLAQVAEPLFVVAGDGKHHAIHGFRHRNPEIVAWQAVEGCSSVELWVQQMTAL
jgi:6-phosphogluconolactonase